MVEGVLLVSMPEPLAFGAPIRNSFFLVTVWPLLSVYEMLTNPDTGLGGRPPPLRICELGARQNKGALLHKTSGNSW